MGILQRLVRNDSMKLDPPEIYNWHVLLLTCAACFGGTLFGMDIGIIGPVITLPAFKAKYGFDTSSDPSGKLAAANLGANIVSVMQAGAFAGALIAFPISDAIGRKKSLLIAACFAGVGGIMQAAASGAIACLYVGRFIEGLGLGAATMLSPTYVSENAPRAIRGMLVAFYQLFETMGAMLAFWIGYGSDLHFSGAASYVVPLSMQILPALLLFSCMLFCNESPRFLAKQDNWDKASSVLSHVRKLPVDHPYIQAELLEMKTQLDEERSKVGGEGFMATNREMWTIPGNRRRALISIALMVCQQMTGTNGKQEPSLDMIDLTLTSILAINYYAPTIFEDLGLNSNTSSLFATGIYGVVKMCSCALFLIFLADTLGRRWSLVWTGIAMGFFMFYLGFYVRFDAPIKGAPVSGAGIGALVMVYLFAAAFQFGWGPVCWIYVSEIPSSRLRGYNVALAAATQWLFNFVVARAVPSMLQTVGAHGYGTYFFFGCFCFAMGILVFFFIPETKGVSLERMDELFGVADFGNMEDVGVAGQSAEKPVMTGTHVERTAEA